MNTKKIICLSLVAVAVSTLASENSKDMAKTEEKGFRGFKDKSSYVHMKAYGGHIRKQGSARGCFAFFNAQKTVPLADLRPALAEIDRTVRPIIRLETGSVDVTDLKSAVAKAGAKLGVAIVENATGPALLTAPEEGWAIVNVVALKRDNPTPGQLAARTRKEMLRAFALVSGCSFMCRGPIVMRNVVSLAELDGIPEESFGVDALNRMKIALPELGITPWIESTYRKACKEGWAPQPTNQYQKAIWDKIHELPSQPITIEPETK